MTSTRMSGAIVRQQVSLSESASRTLTHIRGRTVQGSFASQLWDMPDREWASALDEIRNGGHELYWTHGTVADDPTITGRWRLDETSSEPGDQARSLAQIAQPHSIEDALLQSPSRAHPVLDAHGGGTAKTFEVTGRSGPGIGRGGR